MAEPVENVRVRSVLEDPSAAGVARVYADSLLNAVPADLIASLIEEFESFVNDVQMTHPEFTRLLNSSVLRAEDKASMLQRVLSGRASPLFLNFVKVVARHGRLELLPLILSQTKLRNEIRSGKQRVQIVSAQALSADEQTAVKTTLAAALRTEPILELTVDPTLIGGLRIRVGDTIFDGSVRAKLKQLQKRLHARSVHEIRGSRNRFSHN